MAAAKPTTTVTSTARDSSGDYNTADIATLASLLAQRPTSDADPLAVDDVDIAEELRRLEAANGIADGMEDRLDELIGDLDKLLQTLQGNTLSEAADGRRGDLSMPNAAAKSSPSEETASK
ncbi:hypothetical protein BXZ70DRAFT_1008765 [Cristinia sonorae]|uniref:Uncharacterized protein n=1 Tax=Cristinia sonorae TaxID=1940300 RepID=A0A8K0XP70_9AGAR|nr:hypothetical protein BXZ70DRAFT_1008765 [Cristinia sonorae]